jgi:hypothetical protein
VVSGAKSSTRFRRDARSCRARIAIALAPLLVVFVLAACGGGAVGQAGGADLAADRLVGTWEAEFTAREEHTPFKLFVEAEGGQIVALIERNGEKIPVSFIERRDLVVTIRVSEPELEIFAKMAPNGGSMSGFWRAGTGSAAAELPFKAWRVGSAEDSRP